MRAVSALFETRIEAEAAATRLAVLGIGQDRISIEDQSAAATEAGEPGFFDHLAGLLVAETASPRAAAGFLVRAEVAPEQVQTAATLLETGAVKPGRAVGEIRDQLFEFRETAERLVIGKETVVREEVILRKDVEERVEHVEGSVRHTEVEVERIGPAPLSFGGRTELMQARRRDGYQKGERGQ